MRYLKIIFLLINLFLIKNINAQNGFAWGVKGGLTAGRQNTNNSNSQFLPRYHGALFIESLAEDNKSAMYAQAGYHVRGSAYRYFGAFNIPGTNQTFRPSTSTFQFRNIAAIVGFKKYKPINEDLRYFFNFGVRGEYTLSTNLPSQSAGLGGYFLVSEAVRKFNYGTTIGAGIEKKMSDLFGLVGEISISPDLSKQYYSPPTIGFNPYTLQNETYSERSIRNFSLEISFGLRYLRKVVYVD